MKYVFPILFFAIFFFSCSKDPDAIQENKDMQLIVYEEEVLSRPLIENNTFRLLTRNNIGTFITQFDTSGNKTYVVDLTSKFPAYEKKKYNQISLLNAPDNGYFVVYGFSEISGNDTIPSFGIIKTNHDGVLLWQVNERITKVNTRNVALQGSFAMENGGIAIVFAPNRNPQTQNYLMQIKSYDVSGVNTTNYVSQDFGTYNKILLSPTGDAYVFPQMNGAPGQFQQTIPILIFRQNPNPPDTVRITLPVSDLGTIQNIEDHFIFTGYTMGQPGEFSTSLFMYDYNLNRIYASQPQTGVYLIYNIFDTSAGYIFSCSAANTRIDLSWDKLYDHTGVTALWATTDYAASYIATGNLPNYSSSGTLGVIPTGNGRVCAFGSIRSFDIYKNAFIFKTSQVNTMSK